MLGEYSVETGDVATIEFVKLTHLALCKFFDATQTLALRVDQVVEYDNVVA